jgi:hypothetical protein
MTKDGYKRFSIAVAIVAPVNVFCLLIMVSDASADYSKMATLSLLSGPVTWSLIRLLGWAVESLLPSA